MSKNFIELQRFRRMATGARYSFEPPIAGNPVTEATLERYILDLYVFYKEQMANDVTFLSRVKATRKLYEFDALLAGLRTFYAHKSTKELKNKILEWRELYETPAAALNAVQFSLEDSLELLARAAAMVTKNPKLTEEWARIIEVDVGVVMDAVAREMGLSFRQGKLGYMIRQVNGRLKVEESSEPYADFVAELCSQEIISQRSPLPVKYADVLDHLGLLHSDGASGGLLAAHSVASIAPHLEGADFLRRVEDVWRAAAKY